MVMETSAAAACLQKLPRHLWCLSSVSWSWPFSADWGDVSEVAAAGPHRFSLCDYSGFDDQDLFLTLVLCAKAWIKKWCHVDQFRNIWIAGFGHHIVQYWGFYGLGEIWIFILLLQKLTAKKVKIRLQAWHCDGEGICEFQDLPLPHQMAGWPFSSQNLCNGLFLLKKPLNHHLPGSLSCRGFSHQFMLRKSELLLCSSESPLPFPGVRKQADNLLADSHSSVNPAIPHASLCNTKQTMNENSDTCLQNCLISI